MRSGDSITRGFNACGSFGASAEIRSHYLRILVCNSAIARRNFNDAQSGARVADLPAQASVAAVRRVDYGTNLIGANDACTSTEAQMTPR